jgi:hypothetical protein
VLHRSVLRTPIRPKRTPAEATPSRNQFARSNCVRSNFGPRQPDRSQPDRSPFPRRQRDPSHPHPQRAVAQRHDPLARVGAGLMAGPGPRSDRSASPSRRSPGPGRRRQVRPGRSRRQVGRGSRRPGRWWPLALLAAGLLWLSRGLWLPPCRHPS